MAGSIGASTITVQVHVHADDTASALGYHEFDGLTLEREIVVIKSMS